MPCARWLHTMCWGGLDLSPDYPELGDAILVCATEKRSEQEMDEFAEKLQRVIHLQGGGRCNLKPKDW